MVSLDAFKLSSLLPNWAYVLLVVAVAALAALGIARNRRWLAAHRRSIRHARRRG